MANTRYPKGAEGLLDGSIDLLTDTIVLVAVASGGGGAYNAAHANLSDISSAIIAVSSGLTSKTVTNGAFKATIPNPTWSSVTTNIARIVVAKWTGSNSTSRLIEWRDSDSGLPLAQDGGNVIYSPHGDGLFSF